MRVETAREEQGLMVEHDSFMAMMAQIKTQNTKVPQEDAVMYRLHPLFSAASSTGRQDYDFGSGTQLI